MMASLLAPLGAAVLIVTIATASHRQLRPQIAARFILAAITLVLLAALPTVALIATTFLAHVPVVGVGVKWCTQVIGIHGEVSAWAGIPAVGLLLVGAWRAVRLLRMRDSLRCDEVTGLHLVESHERFAVTLPGEGGAILVSTTLWNSLNDLERKVVITHEQAHARHRHDRFLFVAELAAAVLPPLRSITQRLSFTLERWADEETADHFGDRELVAHTLGRVAMGSLPKLLPGFTGLGVAGRIAALLSPDHNRFGRPQVFLLWSSLGVAATAALVQLHHLERLFPLLCLT
jgi:Zn-dependent protease with chaperone function